jgi:hypothetical protein
MYRDLLTSLRDVLSQYKVLRCRASFPLSLSGIWGNVAYTTRKRRWGDKVESVVGILEAVGNGGGFTCCSSVT